MILHLAAFLLTFQYHNSRANRSDIIIEGTGVQKKGPVTFRKLQTILVQIKTYPSIAGAHSTIKRKGDSIVARSDAGEYARVQVEHTISTARPFTKLRNVTDMKILAF